MADSAPQTEAPASEERLPLLLHSLILYREVLSRCLDGVEPETVVEIGSEGGDVSHLLAGWAGEHGARLISVEPFPSELLRGLDHEDHVTVIEGYSPDELAGVPRAGLYLIDGDHNYATVRAELEAVLPGADADPATGPLVVLHDVGWPCARRDQYYDPDRLAGDDVHEHTWAEGVRPDSPTVTPGGFRGSGAFARAVREGGERNGVLTAVEDALADRPQLELRVSPAVFGVGFVFPRSAPWAQDVRDIVEPLATPLLGRLERNRIDLYVRVLDLQDELEAQRTRFDRARAALEADIARATAETNRLRAQLAERGS